MEHPSSFAYLMIQSNECGTAAVPRYFANHTYIASLIPQFNKLIEILKNVLHSNQSNGIRYAIIFSNMRFPKIQRQTTKKKNKNSLESINGIHSFQSSMDLKSMNFNEMCHNVTIPLVNFAAQATHFHSGTSIKFSVAE